ncbi:MAG: hypothetical protein K2X10_06255 [Hyphomicrobiales bacterium]|nr:hypothetical protein [Hyphomicrobiales bacterium]
MRWLIVGVNSYDYARVSTDGERVNTQLAQLEQAARAQAPLLEMNILTPILDFIAINDNFLSPSRGKDDKEDGLTLRLPLPQGDHHHSSPIPAPRRPCRQRRPPYQPRHPHS